MFVKQQDGFTLVELIIAMALASFVFLALTIGVIRLYNSFEAGNQIRVTQQGARSIIEEISRSARTSKVMATAADALCIGTSVASQQGGTTTYNATIYYRVAVPLPPSDDPLPAGSAGNFALYKTSGTMAGVSCSAPGGTLGERISPDNASVIGFAPAVVKPTTPGLNPRLMTLTLSLASTAALDLVDTAAAIPTCKPESGTQFCSVTSLQTAVASQQEPSQ